MGRELKRVPLNFAWPVGQRWPGYVPDHPLSEEEAESGQWKQDPPGGPGYQLWENTTSGSPQSPVFESLEQLAAWCATNATTWGHCRASEAEWRQMLEAGRIVGRFGNFIGV
jgi:hypothetical protein